MIEEQIYVTLAEEEPIEELWTELLLDGTRLDRADFDGMVYDAAEELANDRAEAQAFSLAEDAYMNGDRDSYDD